MASTDREVIYRLRVLEDDNNARITRQFLSEFQKSEEQIQKVREESVDRAADITKKGHDESIRSELRLQKSREGHIKRQERLLASHFNKQARLREKAQRDQLRSWQRGQSQIKQGQQQVTNSIVSTTTAVARLGRGFALMGIAGEESTEHMMRTLVKVQAIVDLITGGMQTAASLGRLAGGLQMVAAGKQAVAGGGFGAEVAAGAVGSAVGQRMAAGRVAGAGASSFLGVTAAGVGSVATTTGALLAAIAGAGAAVTVGLDMWSDFFRDPSKIKRPGEWFQSWGGPAEKIANFQAKTAAAGADFMPDWMLKTGARFPGAAVPRMVLSQRRGERLEAANAEMRGANARLSQRIAIESQGQFLQPQGIERRMAAEARMAGTAGDRLEAIKKQMLFGRVQANQIRTQQEALNAPRSFTGAGIAGEGLRRAEAQAQGAILGAEAGRLAEHQLALTKDRLQVERQVAQEKRQSAQDSIRSAQRELAILDQKVATERSRLTSAKVRFGNMSTSQRLRAISAMNQARARGVESLNVSQRQILAGMGTREAAGFAEQGAIHQADVAGFDRIFGGQEREFIAGGAKGEGGAPSGAARRALEVNLKTKQDLLVQINADEKKIVAELSSMVLAKMEEQEKRIAKNLATAIAAAMEQLNSKQDAKNQAGNQHFRGNVGGPR